MNREEKWDEIEKIISRCKKDLNELEIILRQPEKEMVNKWIKGQKVLH